MIMKVIGMILAFVGVLILKYFPGSSEYQAKGFSLTGILIGIILILLGIGLVFLG